MLGQLLPWHQKSKHITAHVRVQGRYEPSEIRVPAGTRLRIGFLREEVSSCSERLVFPSLGLNVALPAYEEVVVDLGNRPPGEYEFTCQMGALHGRVVVEQPDGRSEL